MTTIKHLMEGTCMCIFSGAADGYHASHVYSFVLIETATGERYYRVSNKGKCTDFAPRHFNSCFSIVSRAAALGEMSYSR